MIKLKPWMVSLLCLMIALPLVAQSSLSGVPTTSNDLLDPSRVDEACGASSNEDADEDADNETNEGNSPQNHTEDDEALPPDDDDNEDEESDSDDDDTEGDGISDAGFMEWVDQNSDNFVTWTELDEFIINEVGGWDTDAERSVALEQFRTADENNDEKLNITELGVWLSSSELNDDDDDSDRGFIPCERRVHRVENKIAGGLNIIGHMIGGSFMMLSAILTFNSNVLRNQKQLHRIAGYTFITGGALVGISSVSMTVLFPQRFVSEGSFLIFTNLLWGGLLLVAITIAFRAAVQKKFKIHRAWMIRAYLVAAGPSFHRWFFLLGIGIDSDLGDFFVSLGALIVGELIIRKIGISTLREMIQLRGVETNQTPTGEATS